ncbi:MAG TPA: ABC transporter permease [Actinomycetota bacterium]|nr:ABC transporter permease [Actinomycetota bacterium]
MIELLSFLVLGVLQGLTYGIVALGIVLIYKGSRTVNLAQPFMGLFTAYVAWYLLDRLETAGWYLSWIRYPTLLFLFEQGSAPRFLLAAFWSLLLIARIGYRLEHDIMRRLERAPRIITLIATLAIAQGFLGITQLLFERTDQQVETPKILPAVLPQGLRLDIGGLPVTSAYFQILLVVPLVGLAAAAFFKLTKFGVAIRATAENREAAQLLGISARRVASFTWLAGGVLAGIAALLIIPTQGGRLTIASLSTGLLVRALAAALVGGLTSMPGAIVGGVVVGASEFFTQWLGTHLPAFGRPGVPEAVFFALVIGVLVLRPGGLFGQPEETEDKVAFAPSIRDLPGRLRRHPVSGQVRATAIAVGVMLVAAISLATGPSVNGILIDTLIFAIVGASLTVLIGYAGQISLGHFALVGVGAFAAAQMYDVGSVPLPLVFPLAVLAGVVVSLAIGLPALRIRGPYLAIVTLAFAVAAQQWLFNTQLIGRGSAGLTMTPPRYRWLDLGSDTNRPMFFLTFACFLLAVWVANNFRGTRTGRGFFSLRENERAAATFGVQLTRYRLLAFSLSGGIAALAGVLFALRRESFAGRDFFTETSLLLVSMIIIGGLGSLLGSLLGAFAVFGLRLLLLDAFADAKWIQYAINFAVGIALIVVITRARGGLAGLLLRARDPVVEGMVFEAETVRSGTPAEAREPASADA